MNNIDRILNARLDELAKLISRLTTSDGIHSTPIQHLSLLRVSKPDDPVYGVLQPSLCLIAQGAKRVMLGQEIYFYDEARYLVVSVGLPVKGHVIDASPEKPFLCVRLDLNPKEITSMMLQTEFPPSIPNSSPRGLFQSKTSLPLVEAILRLVQLLETPEDMGFIAPLIETEILYHLMKSEEGRHLRQMATLNSHGQRITKVIEWLNIHYAEPLRIEDVANIANMSISSLHHHFKALTAITPLQFQKQLRLQEARKLLLSDSMLEAATVGYRVGYESPSQFSREYSRLFGVPPAQDARRLRGEEL